MIAIDVKVLYLIEKYDYLTKFVKSLQENLLDVQISDPLL
jgi:hypothetical protein